MGLYTRCAYEGIVPFTHLIGRHNEEEEYVVELQLTQGDLSHGMFQARDGQG